MPRTELSTIPEDLGWEEAGLSIQLDSIVQIFKLTFCSMLNWMLYFRGHSKDFDEWEDLGNPGWGWRNVQAFFKKAEMFAGSNDDRTYGTEGRFWVMPMPHVHKVMSLLNNSDNLLLCIILD